MLGRRFGDVIIDPCTREETPISKTLRVNERIRAREIRLIDDAGQQQGIMFTRDALALARTRDLDLVEVAPNAVPPVCRIMDYGKFRYEQSKRDRESKRAQHNVEVKGLRLSPNIDDNDLKTRINAAHRFLDEGHKVRFEVQFKGRELAHTDIGRDLLNRVVLDLGSDIIVEAPAKMEGKKMALIITRKAVQPKSQPRPPRPEGTSGPAPARPEAASPTAEAPPPAAAPAPPRPETPDVPAAPPRAEVPAPVAAGPVEATPSPTTP